MELSLLFYGGSRYFCAVKKTIFLAALVLALAAGRALAEQILFAENFSAGRVSGWENVAFFKKLTDYTVVPDGTNFILRGTADHSCSAFSRKLNFAPPARLTLRWRWKIDGVNTNGSERELKKFDHAARVFVGFDTFIGPPRTLNYLWANVEPAGTVLAHPKSGRAQLFILESGGAQAGQWLAEERDVTADWKKVFPGQPMSKIVGIGVMTDSDSLGQKLTGSYADLALFGE